MAGEFRHKDAVAGRVREVEYEHTQQHILNDQAKGDIVIATTAAQLGRLAKGSDGEVLRLASGLPSWVDLKTVLDYGLAFYGIITTATDTTHFKVSALAGFGAGWFKPNSGAAYEIYIVQADGAAPEGEQTPVVAYTTGDGTFQHAAFTAQPAVDDEVLILHPLIASLGTKATAAATGAVTTTDEAMAYLKQLVTDIRRTVYRMDFKSATIDPLITLNATAGDEALPSVTVRNLPSGIVIIEVTAWVSIGVFEDTSGSENKLVLAGTEHIQVKETAAGSFTDAIKLVANQWLTGASSARGGNVYLGSIDIKAEVDDNDTYDFQIEGADVTAADLLLRDVQTGLIVLYKLE